MSGLHDLHDLLGDGPGILLADELGEGAFEVWKVHEFGQLGRMGIGKNSAVGNHDDTVADLLDNFEHVRDIKNSLALRGQQFQQIFEQSCGNHVESRKGFVEDEQLGVVQKSGCDQNALTHSFRIRRNW